MRINASHPASEFYSIQFRAGFDVLPCSMNDKVRAYAAEREDVWEAGETDIMFGRWRPSIFMPRWASRILPDVTDVRVERVQDISEADAHAEGVEHREHVLASYLDGGVLRGYYEALWDTINAKRPGCSWADNPWVWVITFPRGGGTDE